MKQSKNRRRPRSLVALAGPAIRRAALAARKIAKQYGTPIYIWRDGKVVALKP